MLASKPNASVTSVLGREAKREIVHDLFLSDRFLFFMLFECKFRKQARKHIYLFRFKSIILYVSGLQIKSARARLLGSDILLRADGSTDMKCLYHGE